MKKHIEKKFLHQQELPEGTLDAMKDMNINISRDDLTKMKGVPKDMAVYLTTEDNKFFKAFSYRIGKQFIMIPEPDPILVYFNTAYSNYVRIDTKKKEIFEKLSQVKISEPVINELYDYFGMTSTFITLLFTAIEALVNRSIPKGFIYTNKHPRKTETYNKKQIEEHFTFDDKVKLILPQAGIRSFHEAHSQKWTYISNLRDFRNMIVHTREAESEPTYDYVYKRAFEFDYGKTLDVVKDFCNFYTNPKFIVECPCDSNW